MEHRIDQKATLPDGTTLIATLAKDNTCGGCFFSGGVLCIKPTSWHCFAGWRSDNTHIIYRQENEPSPTPCRIRRDLQVRVPVP